MMAKRYLRLYIYVPTYVHVGMTILEEVVTISSKNTSIISNLKLSRDTGPLKRIACIKVRLFTWMIYYGYILLTFNSVSRLL